MDWQWLIILLSITVGPIIASEYAGWRLGRRIRREVQKLVEGGNPKVTHNVVNWGVEIFKGILRSEEVQDVLKEQTDKFASRLTKSIERELRKMGEELAQEG